MKTILRALLALKPLSIGMACLALCAALALPVEANAGVPGPAQFKIMHSDRAELGDDIAHYRYDAAMGPGKYDVVRIHRIVHEKRPNKPVSTRDALMLLHGNPGTHSKNLSQSIKKAGHVKRKRHHPVGQRNNDVAIIKVLW